MSRASRPGNSFQLTRNQAIIELTLAGAIWGFGFVAVVWALGTLGPLWMTVVRFAIAFVVTFPLLLWKGVSWKEIKQDLFLSFLPGIFLSATLILQTWGLKYTTATQAGFITALYIVIVPLLETYRLGRRPHGIHALAVLGGLAGMVAMTGVGWSPLNQGDFLVLACAFTAAIQIVLISHLHLKIHSTFRFNTLQSFWAGSFALLAALPFEAWGTPQWNFKAVAGILSLGVGSTAFAFMLQLRAQKTVSASTATMLYLLEAPFASLFAIWLLGETVSPKQVAGALLILASAFTAALSEGRNS